MKRREQVDGATIRRPNPFPVDIDGDLDGTVTTLFFHVNRRLPLIEQQRGERVPRGM